MLRKFAWGGVLLGIVVFIATEFVIRQESTVFFPVNSRDVVRLHVIANSDTQYDQMIKLKVRDAILAYMAPKLKNTTTGNAANAVIIENKQEIEEVARRVVLLNGVAYPVEAQIGQFEFPVKVYGDSVYPAGQYHAVRVLLGKAAGNNWWCVLFPPLCFVDIDDTVTKQTIGVNSSQYQNPERKIEFRWKLFELLQRLGKE